MCQNLIVLTFAAVTKHSGLSTISVKINELGRIPQKSIQMYHNIEMFQHPLQQKATKIWASREVYGPLDNYIWFSFSFEIPLGSK